MPLIRYITKRDTAEHGSEPVVVIDNTAHRMVEMRRAVRLDEDDLTELKKAELVEVAEQVGADVSKSDPKAKIAKAVAESEGR